MKKMKTIYYVVIRERDEDGKVLSRYNDTVCFETKTRANERMKKLAKYDENAGYSQKVYSEKEYIIMNKKRAYRHYAINTMSLIKNETENE